MIEISTVDIVVKGNVQRVGYRDKVAGLAHFLGVNGYSCNLPDGSVKIVAQSTSETLEKFLKGIEIKNTLINVENIETRPVDDRVVYRKFDKVVVKSEVASRLDEGIELLKKILDTMKEGNEELREEIHCLRDEVRSGNEDLKSVIREGNEDLKSVIREGNDEINANIKDMHHDLKAELRAGNQNSTKELRDDIKAIKVHLKIP